MGGGYSDLNIYFLSKNGGYSANGCTVTTKQENFKGCSDFQVINHKIQFTNPADGLNYNVILYYGDQSNKGDLFFGYYYPRDSNQVVKEVGCYYSVLAPNVPLAISFKTDTNTYNCYFGKLKNAGWDRAYNIGEYSFSNRLEKKHMLERFKELQFNRKIRFTVGSDNVAITANRQELGENKFRFIFIPNGNDSILGREYLFSINSIKNIPKLPDDPVPEVKELCVKARANNFCEKLSKKPCKIHGRKCHRPKFICEIDAQKYFSSISNQRKFQKIKNGIDEYYLTQVDHNLFDGIIVYLCRDIQVNTKLVCEREVYNEGRVLLLEFIESNKGKVQIKRKDKDGYWWNQEKVEYTNDSDLIGRLKEIDEQAKEDWVTIILEKKKTYLGASVTTDGNKKTYTLYTHKFQQAKKPNPLFNRVQIMIDKLKQANNAKDVEVYYLKTTSGEDTEPFLIVFDEDGNGDKIKKKPYHFNGSYGFKDWVEFTYNDPASKEAQKPDKVMLKLEERISRIEENLSCIDNLNLLRLFAHKILTGDDPKPDEVKKVTVPTRPEVKKPVTVAIVYNLEIILGSVGGVVGLVTLIGGYGIYWYNTTIKLLT